MIEFIANHSKQNLILFIHGFTGSKETWKHTDSPSFPDLLLKDETIADNFDIAHFEYFTKLLNLYGKANIATTLVRRLFKASHGKSEKNVSVDEIANMLRTVIRFQLNSYDNIIVIAHSMGGLVTKKCIIKDIEEHQLSRIKLFISLAVPHQGADAATLGKIISSNVQINDLAPLSALCVGLNNSWVKTSIRPTTKYFYGAYDKIVIKNSAIAIDNQEQDVVTVPEDHFNISKPQDTDSLIFNATTHFIHEFLSGYFDDLGLDFQELDDANKYDDEYFVLKLLIADVHDATIKDAKELFLNAEYARKLFGNESDQKMLANLYSRLRDLYKDSYTKLLHGEFDNSGQLVAEVHEKIVQNDDGYLKSVLPLIKAIHKKGMLHQLANDLSRDIWWTEEQSIDKLNTLRDSKQDD